MLELADGSNRYHTCTRSDPLYVVMERLSDPGSCFYAFLFHLNIIWISMCNKNWTEFQSWYFEKCYCHVPSFEIGFMYGNSVCQSLKFFILYILLRSLELIHSWFCFSGTSPYCYWCWQSARWRHNHIKRCI